MKDGLMPDIFFCKRAQSSTVCILYIFHTTFTEKNKIEKTK